MDQVYSKSGMIMGNNQHGGLSANAAVFIPRNFPPPIGTAPIQNLPTYMTNCFPFVQPDFNGNRPPCYHGNWSRNSRPQKFGNRNTSGYGGNRMPTPNKFSEPPVFPFTSPPPDPFYNQYIPTSNMFINSFPVLPGCSPLNGGQDQTDEKNNNSNNRRRRNQKDKNNFRKSNENIDEGGRKGESSQRQRRRTNSGKKGGNSQNRPPVLVLYEREIQTDFSETFSHLSLVQYPSPLYISHRRHKENVTYENDSDSGYSSPLHRKNQVSSATQSESVTLYGVTSGSVQSDDPSIVHAATVPQKFSYAFMAQKEPSPKPVIKQDSQQRGDKNNQRADNYNERGDKRHKQANKNNSNSGNSYDRREKHLSKRSQENRNTGENVNEKPKNQHINRSLGKDHGNGHHGDKKKPGHKRFNDSDYSETRHKHFNDFDKTRGDYSDEGRKGKDYDYGFSRTKNLNIGNRERRDGGEISQNSAKILVRSRRGPQNETLIDNTHSADIVENEGDTEPGKKKRRRRRRRKKKQKDGEQDSQEEGEPVGGGIEKEIELHFEDVEEFPDLGSAKASDSMSGGVGISYSAMLQSVPVPKSISLDRNKTSSSDDSPKIDNPLQDLKGSRVSRRRRKRKDLLNKEAENELAEIGLEQQMLKEQCLKTTGQKNNKDDKGQTPGILKINPKAQPSGKKSKQNVSLDLGAVINALEQKKTTISLTSVPRKETKPKVEPPKNIEKQKSKGSHNVLDANAPVKRGKERETPKPKKPSPLKKVILKEREEKKHLRMLEGPESAATEAPVGIGVVSVESDLSQDAMSTKSSVDYTGTPGSANLSPVSQTSPISMSPLSPGTSPLSSEVNSPIAGAVGKDVIRKIHSRRFREYCNQVLDKDIDACATTLLQDLVRFQDRMYHKDPSKAKLKRRLVLGLREVTKHLKLKKIKCVIISPNLEKIQSKGGLDDALNNILNLCNEQNVPFVFALGRRALGRACAKLVPVSVVGIFNYSGSEDNFRSLMDLTEKARESYGEMVDAIEKEIKEYPIKMQQPSIPHVFAHMGHSRTPSGASVLSFTSSILSEPISENYPHSEPETDSKGYEIVKDEALIKQGLPTSPSGYQTQMRIIHSNRKVNVDDGNEADNEEEGIKINKCMLRTSEENLSMDGSDMVGALPHIDSIHSSTHDLNTEILSQHSGRTLENCEAMSTHSSRTLGDGSSTILADMGDRSKHGTPKSTESPSNTLQRGKVVDEERIQHWVDETSSRLENLALEEESYEDSTDEMTESDEGSSDSYEKDGFGIANKDHERDKNKERNLFSDCPKIASNQNNDISSNENNQNSDKHDYQEGVIGKSEKLDDQTGRVQKVESKNNQEFYDKSRSDPNEGNENKQECDDKVDNLNNQECNSQNMETPNGSNSITQVCEGGYSDRKDNIPGQTCAQNNDHDIDNSIYSSPAICEQSKITEHGCVNNSEPLKSLENVDNSESVKSLENMDNSNSVKSFDCDKKNDIEKNFDGTDDITDTTAPDNVEIHIE